MKKLFAILLLAAMLLSLTACASASKLLVGTWSGELDMSESLEQQMAAEDPDMAQYFDFSCFKMTMIFEFRNDATYKSYVDQGSYNHAVEELSAAMEDGLYAYFEALIQDMGLGDMSVEELLEASDLSMDDMITDFAAQMAGSEGIDSFASEGRYKADGGKLWLSAGLEYRVDEAVYDTYSLEGDKLTLLTTNDPEADESVLSLYPMTFTKQK